jgi:hypothetical protein
MDSNQKMDLMICEKALELYRAIEVAMDGGRGGYATEKLAESPPCIVAQFRFSSFPH